MKPRKPPIIPNLSRDRLIEINWNLPVKLDVLTGYTLSGGSVRSLADEILDAATELACAKGTWYGQPSIDPVLEEVRDSYRLVSSLLYENPYALDEGVTLAQVKNSVERTVRAVTCFSEILDYIVRLEQNPGLLNKAA